MIVDDDVYVCKGLRALIPWAEMGVDIVGEARNGEDAFNIALEKCPDLIISDIKMPIMDGLELCRKVHDVMVDTSIILLSAYEDFDYARTAIQYGVESYILKPIDQDKIKQLIELIKSLNAKRIEKLSLYKTIYNEELERELNQALSRCDREYFERFFEKDLNQKDYCRHESKALYIRLIEILFNYFSGMGVNIHPLLNSKEWVFEELYTLKTRESMQSYVEQLYMDVLQFTTQKKDSRSEHITEYVKDYINKHYGDMNMSVSEIADSLKLSPAYLSVIFRQFTGINVISHIKKLRIDQACALLNDPSLTISSISDRVGFQNQHYFTRAFKKQTRMTPSEYRNLILNNKHQDGIGS